jgi:hypothetical protein
MRYAQIDRNRRAVVFLHGHPDQWPDLRDADLLVPAGPEVEAGWLWDGARWQPPPPPPKEPISALEFRRRFTQQERGAITLAASRALDAGDPTLQVWLDDLASAGEIRLDSEEVAAALQLLIERNLISPARVADLLA